MKKVLKLIKWLSVVVLVVFIAATVAIMVLVDKELVQEQMQNALNRQVTIKDINIGVFSVVSGIEVNEVKISNFKTEKQLKALKGKSVMKRDLFVGLDSFKFKVKFLPLLKKKFILKELMLYKPVINVVKSKNGIMNFADLVQPKKLTKEEKEALAKAQKEAAQKAKEEKLNKTPSKPLTADDIPIAINIGKIGIENGLVTYNDKQLKQKIRIYSLTAMVKDIAIDSKDLENKNQVILNFNMGIKTLGKSKSKSVQSFDIVLGANGKVTPFDVKTRMLNPEVSITLGSKRGEVTGLQIFEKLKSIEKLEKYIGKVSFLKKTVKWSNADAKAWYKGGLVKIQECKISTDDFVLTMLGQANVLSSKMDLTMDMIVADKHKKKIESQVSSKVKKAIPSKLKKFVTAEQVTKAAMKPLVNENGQVYMKYSVKGKFSSPDTKMVHPKLPSLSDIVKSEAGDAGSKLKGLVSEKANKAKAAAMKKADEKKKAAEAAVKKKADEKKKAAEAAAKKKAKKNIKKIKKPW